MAEQGIWFYLAPTPDIRKMPSNIPMRQHWKYCVPVSEKPVWQKIEGIYRKEEQVIKEHDIVIYWYRSKD